MRPEQPAGDLVDDLVFEAVAESAVFSSQIDGLMFSRYILAIEPVASSQLMT